MQMKLNSVIRNMVMAAAVSGITFAASAADGQINFTGTILDSACTIDTNTANQTVNLGKIPKSSFNAAGAVAAATRFREGANKQVISSQADSLIKISRIWADFFPANTSNQPI
ncbi:fimbrial protein [Enterobacter kobei]|uniref:fimbrial protein n=1 Tax=Enterobacter kobei TaxID=208224 RepID=UPI00292D8045|nr:fimbrial protein [Enterobacter kobei]